MGCLPRGKSFGARADLFWHGGSGLLALLVRRYPIEVLEFAWRKYGSRMIRAVHRYPGFAVVARSRDRLKLGQRVFLYGGLPPVLMGE